MLFLAESLSSPGVPNLGTCTPGGTFAYLKRYIRSVTRLDGARDKKQVCRPCSKRVFRKQMYCIEKSACDIVGTFRHPRSDLVPPYWLGARGIAPPSLHLWVHLLNSRNKLTSRHKIDSNYSSINIQWIFVILFSLFVKRIFRGTSSHAELLKGYMVRERLGTPALTCGNIFP